LVTFVSKKKIALVTADGAFDFTGHENDQEVMMYPLITSELLAGLMVLAPKGSMVVKCFDLYTEFMCQLLYLFSLLFENMTVFKPVSSRPANSERYLIFQHLKTDVDVTLVIRLLKSLIPQLKTPTTPLKALVNESNGLDDFRAYLTRINTLHAESQYTALEMIKECASKKSVINPVVDLNAVLEFWNVPSNAPKPIPKRSTVIVPPSGARMVLARESTKAVPIQLEEPALGVTVPSALTAEEIESRRAVGYTEGIHTMIPVRCYTCGTPIRSSLYERFLYGIYFKDEDPNLLLNQAKVFRPCCRALWLSTPVSQLDLQEIKYSFEHPLVVEEEEEVVHTLPGPPLMDYKSTLTETSQSKRIDLIDPDNTIVTIVEEPVVEAPKKAKKSKKTK